MSVWKPEEKLFILHPWFLLLKSFVWEAISSIRHNVSSPDETPRSSSKILRQELYFQLSSQRFIWWWNTASLAWSITSQSDIVQLWWPLHKSRQNIYTQFMCFRPWFYKTSGKTEICKTFLCKTVKLISDFWKWQICSCTVLVYRYDYITLTR